jgi:hypothetical protein
MAIIIIATIRALIIIAILMDKKLLLIIIIIDHTMQEMRYIQDIILHNHKSLMDIDLCFKMSFNIYLL